MNIKGVDNVFNIGLSNTKKAHPGDGFKQILDKTVSEINQPDPTKPVGKKDPALEHSDKVLNLLDRYAGKLADPSTSLKEIHPLVTRIQEEVDLLEARAADVPDQKGAGQLFKDLAIMANVAVLKFQRGDFI